MAYQPKFAADANKPQPPRREERPAQQPEEPREKSKAGRILFILLGIVVIPAALAATVWLMTFIFFHVGKPKQVSSAPVRTMDVGTPFREDALRRQESLLEKLAYTPEETEEPTEPEETEPPVVHQHYELPEDTVVPPKPDQSRFGKSNDPEELQKVLSDAAWLLDGQTTYFSPDLERYEEEDVVRWYLDDSIFAVTWKEVHEGSVYTFSEIKLGSPSQFRRHMAAGEYGSEMQFLTTEMAESVNAVVASAGDFYRFRNFGAVVYEGKARRVEGTYAETCYIDYDGNMHFTRGGEVLTVSDVQKFVDEHNINFSLAFGPILVDNGEPVEHTWYGVGEINEGYARSALCQLGDLHYIVMTANTQGKYQDIPKVSTFSKYVIATGCINAYCLDGGQTATIVMNNELINRPVFGQQRKTSDIIYFATAVPEGA